VVQGRNQQDSGDTSTWLAGADSPAPIEPEPDRGTDEHAAASEPTSPWVVGGGQRGSADTSSWIKDPQSSADAAPTHATWVPPVEQEQAAAAATAQGEVDERRAKAVAAFFVELSGRASARQLTEESLAEFAQRSAAGELDSSVASLLRVTRGVAARRKLVFPPRSGWKVAVARALSEEGECSHTPELLSARAAGELSEADRHALDSHLAECPTCRAAAVRWDRAERAFAAVMQFGAAAELAPINGEVTELLPAPAAATSEFAPGAAGAAVGAVGAVGAAAAPAGAAAAAAPSAWTSAGAADATGTPEAAEGATATMPAVAPTGPRRGPRRRLAIVAGALIALIACAGTAAALLNSSSSHHPTAKAPTPTPAATTPQPTRTTVKHHAAHHKRVVHHRHKAKRKPAPAPTAVASAPATTATATAPTSASSGPVSSPSPQPVAVTPSPSSSGGGGGGGGGGGDSGGGGGSGPASATLSQPSLGASSAPTQGISPKK
jgi:hypothetical protein